MSVSSRALWYLEAHLDGDLSLEEHGLSAARLEPLREPMFERYGIEFDSRTGNGGLEIWVPVKR